MIGFLEIETPSGHKRVSAQMVKGQLWLHVDGETHVFEGHRRRSAKGSSKTIDGTVIAPMPGKILKLGVTQGQKVKVGQLLVVMEAMKMEYSYSAELDGVVEQIGCSVGQQVAVSQLLVKVRPNDT